jgi:hypothetical protein
MTAERCEYGARGEHKWLGNVQQCEWCGERRRVASPATHGDAGLREPSIPDAFYAGFAAGLSAVDKFGEQHTSNEEAYIEWRAGTLDAPPTAAQAEVYPNSDRGLLAMTERWADMTRDARLGTLRGIQQAAFRAGREDAIVRMSTAAQARPTREEVAKAAGDAVRNAQVFHGDLRTAGYYGPSNDAAELAAAAERAVLALYPPAADPKAWSSYGDALTASDDGPVPTRELSDG